MRPLEFKPFPQPSSSGTSQYVTVILIGDRIDQIEANGKTITIDPAKLTKLHKEAETITASSSQGLEFPHVLALVIRDYLENPESKPPTAPIAGKKIESLPELKIPEPLAPTEPRQQTKKSKIQRYALSFTWSEEVSHLNLLTGLTLIRSGKTKKNQIALARGTNKQLQILLSQKGMPKKIDRLLRALVRKINQEENLDLSSDQQRISHSVKKAKDYLDEELRKLKQAPAIVAMTSPASSTDVSSSSSSRYSLFNSQETTAQASRKVRFEP